MPPIPTLRATQRSALAILLLCVAFTVFVAPLVSASHAATNGTTTVYVTNSGTKYHAAGCSSLRSSAISMPLSEAAARFGPCSRCRPPALSGTDAASTSRQRPGLSKAASGAAAPGAGGQCQATTKKGTQCRRRAVAGSAYCWQHQGR